MILMGSICCGTWYSATNNGNYIARNIKDYNCDVDMRKKLSWPFDPYHSSVPGNIALN